VEVEIIRRENWAYSLEKRDGKYILSVLRGGVGMYDVEVELAADVAMSCISNKTALDSLAERIRYSPEKYKKIGSLTELL
jgi:hypothetical protein